MLRTLTAVLFLLLLPLQSSSAASLVVDTSGILTGASGIDYLGKKYDVAFRDGSCVGLFTGCNEQSDFPFQASDAAGAGSALLALLVTDGRFVNAPAKIFGCTDVTSCDINTPETNIANNLLSLYTQMIRIEDVDLPLTFLSVGRRVDDTTSIPWTTGPYGPSNQPPPSPSLAP
jgi:hypothetical protein